MGGNNDRFLQLNETVIHHNDKQPNRTEFIEKINKTMVISIQDVIEEI